MSDSNKPDGGVGWASRLGLLPRTRPIVPGELAVSD